MSAHLDSTSIKRMAGVALFVLILDQFTKYLVLRTLGYADQRVVIDGFFKLVHWGNTGAAWSLFTGKNKILAVISLLALVALFYSRRHFDAHTLAGQCALGLMFGGILGNLTDRIQIGHVVDFLYFYVTPRGGDEIGFPAFNVADSSICVGVGLLFILSWRAEHGMAPQT
jgi:signal peptidase II